MNIQKTYNVTGTSLQDYVEATYDELVKVFGEPHIGPNSDYKDKVTCEWNLMIDDTIVTIYDYKEDRTPMGNYQWHIGGFNGKAAELVYDAFFQSKQI